MKLSLLKIAVCTAVMSLWSLLPAAECDKDGKAMIEGAVNEVLAIAYDGAGATSPLSQRLRPVLETYFNFEVITRKAIGPGWQQFTPEQQASAVTLFTEVVIRNYADRFEAGARPNITYLAEVVLDPNRPNVRDLPTTIDYAGKKYTVVYRLEKTGECWRIVDVKIEGVSMIANWRAQLNPLFQHGKAPEVLSALKQNLAHPVSK